MHPAGVDSAVPETLGGWRFVSLRSDATTGGHSRVPTASVSDNKWAPISSATRWKQTLSLAALDNVKIAAVSFRSGARFFCLSCPLADGFFWGEVPPVGLGYGCYANFLTKCSAEFVVFFFLFFYGRKRAEVETRSCTCCFMELQGA